MNVVPRQAGDELQQPCQSAPKGRLPPDGLAASCAAANPALWRASGLRRAEGRRSGIRRDDAAAHSPQPETGQRLQGHVLDHLALAIGLLDVADFKPPGVGIHRLHGGCRCGIAHFAALSRNRTVGGR